jgi:putative peptide zinc metalloprotease protein
MRLDGYYILADLVEIPNLRQKALAIIQRKLGAWLLGLRERPDPFLPARRQWLLAAFGVASAAYGWLVALSIFWFCYRVLEPYGLKLVGQLLGVAMIVSLVIVPVVNLVRFLLQPARPKDVNKMRALISVGVIAGAVAAALVVPLPYYVWAVCEVQPRAAVNVYAEVAGTLTEVARASGPIEAGQGIAQLEDPDSRLAAQRLIAQRGDLAARLESIRQRAHADEAALLELSQTAEALASLDRQIARLKEDLARLTIVAPAGGSLVPPPSRPAEETDGAQLATWTGRPLARHNIGAYLPASTLLCQIAQPGKLEAVLAIEQETLEFVSAGQRVELVLPSQPGKKFAGQISHVAEKNMEAAPARLSAQAGGQLATRTSASGIERPIAVFYPAAVPLDDDGGGILIGATGQAKIHAGYQPLGQRLWRACCATFRFKL